LDNQDQIEHTVTAGVPDTVLTDFEGSLAGKGSTFGVTFDRAGSYRYFCARHHFMRGEIRVLTTHHGAR
jgi:plastocyanin